jgi:hypothetical protein
VAAAVGLVKGDRVTSRHSPVPTRAGVGQAGSRSAAATVRLPGRPGRAVQVLRSYHRRLWRRAALAGAPQRP